MFRVITGLVIALLFLAVLLTGEKAEKRGQDLAGQARERL